MTLVNESDCQMTITSKGNGRNFYGFQNGKIYEVVKEGGKFYIAKFKHGSLTAVGKFLTDFTLIEK